MIFRPYSGVSALRAPSAEAPSAVAVFAVAVAYLVKGTYNPFIYFNF